MESPKQFTLRSLYLLLVPPPTTGYPHLRLECVPFFATEYITLSSSSDSPSLRFTPPPDIPSHRYHPHAVHTNPPPPHDFFSPRFPSAKLSKRTEQTYLSFFFASISDLYGHLLKRLQRFCRMRVGTFEDRSEVGPPSTSTGASGMVRDVVGQGPSFDMVVIGCGGGPFETDLSA